MVYNEVLADRSVDPRQFVQDKRFWRILATILQFLAGCARQRLFSAKSASSAVRRKQFAVRLRNLFLQLGPTYIKFGQFLSVRRDCLPVEIADELALLQDQVPAFSFADVRNIFLNDFGKTPDQIFAEFEKEPIAAASIAQVHRAKLADGSAVVVKVQRANLAHIFYQDIGCLRKLIRIACRFNQLVSFVLPFSPPLSSSHPSWQQGFNNQTKFDRSNFDRWLGLSNEFGKTLFCELDFLKEGRNALRVRQNLKELENVKIPRIIWKHTSRRVLTMEYLPGIKIDNVRLLIEKDFNPRKISKMLFNCYLEQMLTHGFFQADPHAGNLSIDHQGKIIIYDFGVIGQITDRQRFAISHLIAGILAKNIEEIVKHLAQLGILSEGYDKVSILATLKSCMDYFGGQSATDADLAHLERDIDRIILNGSWQLPADFSYLLRTGNALTGVAQALDPQFNFSEAMRSFIKKWLWQRSPNVMLLCRIFRLTLMY